MRRLWLAPAVGALALAGALAAADLKVEENPVPANSFSVVSVPLAKGDRVVWDVTPEPTRLEDVGTDAVAKVHFNGPPGTAYTVTAFVVNFDTKQVSRKR